MRTILSCPIRIGRIHEFAHHLNPSRFRWLIGFDPDGRAEHVEKKESEKMKAMKFRAVLLALLLAGMAMVSCVSAIEKPVGLPEPIIEKPEFSLDNPIIPEEDYVAVLDVIKSGNLSEEEKESLITALDEIWSSQSNMNNQEKETIIKKAKDIVLQNKPYYPDEEIKWGYDPHTDIAKRAGEEMFLSSMNCQTLHDYADDPDYWGQPFYEHDWFIQLQTGGAPYWTKYYADQARGFIKEWGDETNGFRKLAYSMHYMTDLSNPTHTEASDRSLILHDHYETYLTNNWMSGWDYYTWVQQHPYYYYEITDPEASAKNEAGLSNGYMDHLWWHYLLGNFNTDTSVRDDTRQLLRYTVAYDMGLIDYATR